jgi:CIC family chloride channel protein
MAGFFAGVAKTPISTLLMVGELTGNYSLLLPSMLVVCLAMIIGHRWTIYSEQVRTRAESPVHRGELLHDVLAELVVGDLVAPATMPRAIEPRMSLRDMVRVVDEVQQPIVSVVDGAGRWRGVVRSSTVRSVLAEDPARGIVIAEDLIAPDIPVLRSTDTVDRALELLALQHVDVLPVLGPDGELLGMLDRRAILGAYRRRIEELRTS